MEAETDHWKQALHQSIALFVEEELKPYFGELISFIRMVEIAGGVSKVQLGKLPFVNIFTRKGSHTSCYLMASILTSLVFLLYAWSN